MVSDVDVDVDVPASCQRHDGGAIVDTWRLVDGSTGHQWLQADPEIHITADQLLEPDLGPLIEGAYRMREPCPQRPDGWHAVRYERPLP